MTRRAVPTIGVAYFEDDENPMKQQLAERIREWAELVVLDPERRHPALPTIGLDLYHMADWSAEAYSDFRLAHETGIPTVNSYDGARATEDRVTCARRCVDHGLPYTPFEYGTADEITLDPPVLVKPRHEVDADGHEFQLIHSRPISFGGEMMVEKYTVPSRSFKTFYVGGTVRVTERKSVNSRWREANPSSRFFELAESVAELFDLQLFELDVLVHKAHYIIDVNPVVSLEGVDDGLDLYEQLMYTMSGTT